MTMTATDELRRMLDERGVEWSDSSDEAARYTGWNDSHCWFIEFPDGWTSWGMLSNSGTPAQAIEATLGRGECRAVKVNRMADDNDPYDIRACSECGAYLDPMWHYCGICGRKVAS